MKNLKSFNQFVTESLNESTSLNTIGISQKAIKNLSGGKISSHTLEYTPFSGTKKDVKNEMEKGNSLDMFDTFPHWQTHLTSNNGLLFRHYLRSA